MFRVTKMGINIFAAEFDDLDREKENIEGLLEAGDHVLLVNDLEDAAEVFDVEVSDITVVETE